MKKLLVSIAVVLGLGTFTSTTVNADEVESVATNTMSTKDTAKYTANNIYDRKIIVLPANPIFKGTYEYLQNLFSSIPGYLKKDNEHVDLGKFNKRGQRGEKVGPKGWTISPDTSNHGGSKWKLKDKSDKRVASLSGDGKILRK